jgi:hypothetical protein
MAARGNGSSPQLAITSTSIRSRRRAGEEMSPMLHASALAVGWRSALLALLPRRQGDVGQIPVSGTDITKQCAEADDDREPFHLDDTELALRLVSRGLQEYRTPPHAHLMFPQLPAR